ncbi:MAG TPA: cobyrinate a,c-diamide synthase [Nitrospiria bacterium]|nr:cobyrinate a,c-diamide synthase [Nitrospiria bacterium]
MNRPSKGILIGALQSGAGKTTATLAILESLVSRGLNVQAFKVGPDYLDPTFHQAATGRPSRNLDGWMMGKGEVLKTFHEASQGADIAVIEGVMGLFDGLRGRSEEGSAAQIAKWLSVPVILVIDAKGLARTAGAIVLGIQQFDPQVNIQGIIFNRVGSRNHLEILKESVETVSKIKVLGGIPREECLAIPARHLGLVQAEESLTVFFRSRIREIGADRLDLEGIIGMAGGSYEIPESVPPSPGIIPLGIKIGVARDRAFHFYYEDNLDALRRGGAEIVFFSPMADVHIPDVDGLFLGGGYPEAYARELSENRAMMESIRAFAASDGPIYAECGGLIYLSEGVQTAEGSRFPMAGLLPGSVKMGKKLKALGYREISSLEDNLLFKKGEKARGHEYHYSAWVENPQTKTGDWFRSYQVSRTGMTESPEQEGFARGNVLASYIHLHFGSNPALPARWVEACQRYKILRSA